MSIVKLCHFFPFIQNMISNVIGVHFLLGWFNFRVSMNNDIAFGFFSQYFVIYVHNDLALRYRNIILAFPCVALRVY